MSFTVHLYGDEQQILDGKEGGKEARAQFVCKGGDDRYLQGTRA